MRDDMLRKHHVITGAGQRLPWT